MLGPAEVAARGDTDDLPLPTTSMPVPSSLSPMALPPALMSSVPFALSGKVKTPMPVRGVTVSLTPMLSRSSVTAYSPGDATSWWCEKGAL